MSLNLDNIGGYGSGKLGDSSTTAQINSYARITGYASNYFTIADVTTGTCPFAVGNEVLILCTIPTGGSASDQGFYRVATITAVSGDKITVDKSVSDLPNCHKQAITIPHFKNFTVSGSPSVPAFANYRGGVFAIKCSDTLTFAGGHINLQDKGIPTSLASYRLNTNQENNGTLDVNLYSGCENSITKDRLIMNVGDGVAFIVAKNIRITNANSRIGNPSFAGIQYCRGASDSRNRAGNITNIGGSTIFIATDAWNPFYPQLIAKYRNASSETGKGLARAYIAIGDKSYSGQPLPDEGLYALDVIQDKMRLYNLGIRNFGDGRHGSFSNNNAAYTVKWNSYATITSISGKNVYISSSDDWGVAKLEPGALVMIHITTRYNGTNFYDGLFKIARVVDYYGNTVTVDIAPDLPTNGYYAQLVVIPQYTNFTLGCETKEFPNFDGYYTSYSDIASGGGIVALACSGTCNISGGQINTRKRGHFHDFVNPAVGNAYMNKRLPIGNGFGSVFILAKTLTMNSSSRLGAMWSGAGFGGKGGGYKRTAEGGYMGPAGVSAGNSSMNASGGWGGGAGISETGDPYTRGGWFSNVQDFDEDSINVSYWHGAHLFIVAENVNSFQLAALSTGGGPGHPSMYTWNSTVPGSLIGTGGGAGYGGGGNARTGSLTRSSKASVCPAAGAGGYRGGGGGCEKGNSLTHGGGAAGACFIYCNNGSQVLTGIVTD